MKDFEFFAPKTLEEAKGLLHQYKDVPPAIIAGGTDLVIEINDRWEKPDVVIDIKKLKELEYIRVEENTIHIGALSTFTQIENHPFIRSHVRALYKAASQVGSPQIRNLGTIGGNLSTSSVAGDGVSAMTTLDATVVLESVRGTRKMKLTDFFDGEGFKRRNALEADEIMTEVIIDRPDAHSASAFYKLAKRKSLAISVIGGGMAVKVDDAGVCTWASMRGGCIGRYPLHFKQAEEMLVGAPLTMEAMEATLPILHDTVYDMARARPSVLYKKESVQGVFKKLFVDILDQLEGGCNE